MKIFYGSDIHLEFGRGSFIIPECDVLLLAGDIFTPHAPFYSYEKDETINVFFRECSKKCGVVYMIMGNHEHYLGDIDSTKHKIIRQISTLDIKNIHVLNDQVVEFGDYELFASTFWTDIKQLNPMACLSAKISMNDFVLINQNGSRFTPEQSASLNHYSRSALYDFLLKETNKIKIVMTHHAPFFESVPDEYLEDEASYAYANTKIYEILNTSSFPEFWIHGHMHTSSDYFHLGVKVLCNPHGYVGHENTKNFQFKELKNWRNKA